MNRQTDSVRVVVFDANNTNVFLVLSEKDDPENLKLPGGKFENETETPDQAVTRELTEELGITKDAYNLVRVAELVNDDGISKRFIFSTRCQASLIKPTSEVDRTQWCTEKSIPECKNSNHILAAVKACTQL